MAPRLAAIDRIVTAITGAALMAGGLALLDWHYGWTGTFSGRLATTGFDDLSARGWWPWTYAAVGILIGLLGLAWMLAHAPRRAEGIVPLSEASDQTGAIRIDLGSIAKAAAADLESTGAVAHVRGTARRVGRVHLIELRGQLDPLVTDGAAVESAVARCTHHVSEAFPDGRTVCRVLLGHDRRHPGSVRTSARIVR